MILPQTVTVVCDNLFCPEGSEIDVTVQGGSYTNSFIEMSIKESGWFVREGTHFCPVCSN